MDSGGSDAEICRVTVRTSSSFFQASFTASNLKFDMLAPILRLVTPKNSSKALNYDKGPPKYHKTRINMDKSGVNMRGT